MSTVAVRARRQADLTSGVKYALIVVNALIGIVVVIAGFAAAHDPTVLEGGYTVDVGSGPNAVLIGSGIVQLLIGTLALFVVFGFFEHVLRTNAELVRLAEIPEETSYQAGSNETLPTDGGLLGR